MKDSSSQLTGIRVINTRPIVTGTDSGGPNDKLTGLLEAAGAEVISHPAIVLDRVGDPERLCDQVLNSNYRTAVFVSAAGVHFFAEFLRRQGVSVDRWAEKRKIAAIGPGTAKVLAEFGLNVDLVPQQFNSEHLGQELVAGLPEPYLVLRADRGSRELADVLTASGKGFVESVIYRSSDVVAVEPEVGRMLESEAVDWVTLTSPAIASSTLRLFGDCLSGCRVVTISDAVADVVRQAGLQRVAVAKRASFESMVAAIVEAGCDR